MREPGKERISGGRERELFVNVGVRLVRGRPGVAVGLAMRTARAAGPSAGAERLVDDGLDGARATATFGAAAEAAIDLLGTARKTLRRGDGAADIMIGQDVTGTNNHENSASPKEVMR